MKYYPVFLNLKDREVLLVGAGVIGLQKIQGLLDSEARIHVVSPEALQDIEQLAKENRLRWDRRTYMPSDLDGKSLVIAATDDPELQKRIASEARARGIWVNIVDVPPLCDFIAPAIVNQGDIQIAISTGGAAPALAKFIRKKLEPMIGPEYAQLVRMVQSLRPDILKMPKPQRAAFWESIVSQSFLDQIRTEGPRKAEAYLKEWIYGKSVI
jgi:precorrin-2 dehydrogenase / sirohydrochlorin ferrochelatase